MKQRPYPFWRSWLSHLSDQILVAGEGEHGDELAVVLRKGKVLLQSNGAIYSWEDNYYNFRRAFEKLNWELLPGTRTLILGLGLGSIPQMIEEVFDKALDYTAVEYDEAVVELAEEYLLYRLSSPITTSVADARAFVRICEEEFDLILIDIFVDDIVPKQFETKEFLRDVEALLAPNGCVISNRLTYRMEDRDASKEYFQMIWKHIFPEGSYMDVTSNWMLYSDDKFLKDV